MRIGSSAEYSLLIPEKADAGFGVPVVGVVDFVLEDELPKPAMLEPRVYHPRFLSRE